MSFQAAEFCSVISRAAVPSTQVRPVGSPQMPNALTPLLPARSTPLCNPPLFIFQNSAPSFLLLSSTSRFLPGCAPAAASHT